MPAYHTVPLAQHAHTAPAKPSVGALRPWEPVEWWPARNVMAAQDTLVACARRPLLSFGLNGSDDWPFPDNGTGGAPPTLPHGEEWRMVYPSTDTPITPGSYLRLRVLYCPSGPTVGDPVGGPSPETPPNGAIRVTVTWTAADGTTSGPHSHDAELFPINADGDLPTGGAALWPLVYETEILEIMPPGVDSTNATAAVYSELCTASVSIYLRGGARIIDAVLYEYPLRHTQAHDMTDPASVHGAVVGGGPSPEAAQTEMTDRPQIRKRDGVAYSERRFGTHQTLRTAHQQTEVLGPRIMAWSPWLSDADHYTQENSLAENNVEPVIITGTTTLTNLITSATSYDADGPGWLCHASHAQLARYSESNLIIPGGGRAVVPVRVQVRARWTGTTSGLVRVQSSTTEWVDVVFSSSGSLQTREVIGWLESQAAADQPQAVIQVFGQNLHSGDELEVYAVVVDWGWNR